jgi:sugar-specific transcriptional regulator TrmB
MSKGAGKMNADPIHELVKIGFSEYEAKAYVALLRKSPVTGYELSKLSGVPRSMIYEVLGKLTARGAAMTLRTGSATKYAPVSAEEFLDQLEREQQDLIASLKDDLTTLASAPDLEYVWNIEGHENIMVRAAEMIGQAEKRVYLALLPATFPTLLPALEGAIHRGVQVVIYTPSELDLPGGQVVAAPLSEEALTQVGGLGLILVIDGQEVLVGEWLTETQARASWTSSPLLVFIAEHHLRTDLYLPQILALLGDRALDIIQEQDRELFARAMESHIAREM